MNNDKNEVRPLNLINGRWLNDMTDPAQLSRDMAEIGPLGLVRCLLGERRFFPSGPPAGEWNVAGHSMLTALVFLRLREDAGWPPEWLAFVLLHDAHEGFIRDIPSPIKRAIGPMYKDLADGVDRGIRDYLGMPDPLEPALAAVKHCDLVALLLEAMEWGLTIESGPEDFPKAVVADYYACGGGGPWNWRKPIKEEG